MPHLAASLVAAPFEVVLAAEVADARRGMIDGDTGARHPWTHHLLRGGKARFPRPFAPETAHLAPWRGEAPAPADPDVALRGSRRISRTADGEVTICEEPLGWSSGVGAEALSDRLGAPVLSFVSVARGDARGNWMHYVHGETVREIRAVREGGRWQFRADGPVQAFETPDAYARPRKADRLTRAMIFDYAAAFGVDLASVFGGDAVRDSVLITTDHAGEPLAPLGPGEADRCAN